MRTLYRQRKESGTGLDKKGIKYLKRYIGERIGWLAVILCIAAMMAGTMFFNGVPASEIGYGLALCAFVTAVVVFTGYGRHWESLCKLEQMRDNITVL